MRATSISRIVLSTIRSFCAKLIFTLVLVAVFVSGNAHAAYFIDGEVTGYRCTDIAITDICKKIPLSGYIHKGNFYKFEANMGFNKVSEFTQSRTISTKGTCRNYVGYRHSGWWGSKLFKLAADKVISADKTIGLDGEAVTVDYVEFRCYTS